MELILYLTIILICVGVCSAGSMPAMGSALVGGVEFHENLLHGEVVCRSVPVPMFAESVLVEASVTGLRGNPNIFGGWEEREIVDMIASNLAINGCCCTLLCLPLILLICTTIFF